VSTFFFETVTANEQAKMDAPLMEKEKEDDSDAYPDNMRQFQGLTEPGSQSYSRYAIVAVEQDLPRLWQRYQEGKFNYLDWNMVRWMSHQRTFHQREHRKRNKVIKYLLKEGGIMAAHREAMKNKWEFAEEHIISKYVNNLESQLSTTWTLASLSHLRPYPEPTNADEQRVMKELIGRGKTDRLDLLDTSGSYEITMLTFQLEWIPDAVARIRKGTPMAKVLRSSAGMDPDSAREVAETLQEVPRVSTYMSTYTDMDQVPDRVPYQYAISTCLYALLILGWMGASIDGRSVSCPAAIAELLEAVKKYGTLNQRAAVKVAQSYYRVYLSWHIAHEYEKLISTTEGQGRWYTLFQ